jgi:catechol 2,3-dioxygenase-like lactoylglutathione lyase family enzyme/predicted enzyme related to lactoylglutathione lyase
MIDTMNRPSFGFDGGFIMASWDGFEKGVDWYSKHFGWTCCGQELTPIGKMAFFPLPRFGQANLKSFQTEWEHYQDTDRNEGHFRLCFSTEDIDALIRYFQEHEVKVSAPQLLPDGRSFADIYAFEGARITAVQRPSKTVQFADSRLISFGDIALIITVSDIQKSLAWYEKMLGFEKLEDGLQKGTALLRMPISIHGQKEPDPSYPMHVWMIEDPKILHSPKGNPMCRTYFQVFPQELEASRAWLSSHDVEISELAMNDYHFFDPDGNRINIWSYEIN